MVLFVALFLAGAAFYFVWRRSASPLQRIVANTGGMVAIVFLLLANYGSIRYFTTPAP